MNGIFNRRTVWIVLLSLVFTGASVMGEEQQRLFEEGNAFYREGEWAKALAAYDNILTMGYESGFLYYNMGNCYYKLENVGRSILYYERARKWIPGNPDLMANLALANLSVVDKIEPLKEFIVSRLLRGVFTLFPYNTHVIITLTAYCFFMGTLITWIVTRRNTLRKVMVRMIWILGIVFLILGISLAGRSIDQNRRIEAVILADRVDVMSAPNPEGGIEVFTLHEGTKVRLDQRAGDWIEIILADGKVGWVKREVLEII